MSSSLSYDIYIIQDMIRDVMRQQYKHLQLFSMVFKKNQINFFFVKEFIILID